jgi:hypothetical protein
MERMNEEKNLIVGMVGVENFLCGLERAYIGT